MGIGHSLVLVAMNSGWLVGSRRRDYLRCKSVAAGGIDLFSVGEGEGLLDGADVVVVVVVEVEGASLPLLPHAAVNAPIAISAAPPATARRRRLR